jgi:hypothetical protein
MRILLIGIVFVLGSSLLAQDNGKGEKRYGFDLNDKYYPQKTPQETLQSVVKAIESNRIDYLLAQLADPRFVDVAVANYMSVIPRGDESAKRFLAFNRLVDETTQYYLEDPTLLKELRLFAKEAEWEGNDAQTAGTLKTIQGRKVYLRKEKDRWFLENKQQ